MTKSNQAVKSMLVIMIFALGSKFLGFFREILIAAKFGSGMETDTFFIAIGATTLLTGITSNAIKTTFIPVLSKIESKEGKQGKIDHTNNMINVVIFFSTILVVVAWFLSPIIINLMAKGFHGEQYKLAIKLLRIGLPMIIFSSIVGTLTGFLQSEQRHTSSAAIGFPFNFVYIFFLLFLSSTFGIKGLMVAAVFAVLSQILLQLLEVKKIGYKYKFIFDLKDKYIKKVLYLSIPVIIGVAINDLNSIIDKTLASSLVTGSISALNYANKLNTLILGVFITAITTVIFPILSKEANNDNIPGVKKTMGYGVNLILLITIPATVGLIVLAKPIVEIAFQRGEFGATATMMTSQALIFYSIGLVAMALRLLVTRVYYSLQDTKTPMINGAISVGFNIVLNLILVQYMGHAGLALATSIATTIATLLMFHGLKKKIGSLGTLSYIKCGLKAGLASAIMGVVAYVVYHGLYGILGASKLYNLISLLVAVGLAVIVYGVLCYLFGIEEVRDIVDKVIKRLK
ncbi:MAG: murein biosynthesis integral membrane protein MurJ [Tissierellaceae bacterium]|nr:murein biosynthesis integral membrane protein MurJ [Tissierellaceae bacterium]